MLSIYDRQLCTRFPARRKSMFFYSFFMEKLLKSNGGGYNYNEARIFTESRNFWKIRESIKNQFIYQKKKKEIKGRRKMPKRKNESLHIWWVQKCRKDASCLKRAQK